MCLGTTLDKLEILQVECLSKYSMDLISTFSFHVSMICYGKIFLNNIQLFSDLYKFEDGIGEKVPMFINFQVVFLASLIIALVKGWELALICLTSLPASLIVLGIIGFVSTIYVLLL